MMSHLRRTAGVLSLFLWMLVVQACDSGETMGIEVVRYNGAPITAESTLGLGRWTASVDTLLRQVTLDRVESNGAVRHRLVLYEVEDDLPAYGGYTYQPDTEYSANLRSGKGRIQHFDLEGEISGLFEGRLTRPIGAKIGGMFWVNLSKEE